MQRRQLRRLTPEFLLMLGVLAGLARVVQRFYVDGKLPQPFIFDINDTFMDWFNTAYWAHNPGAFDVWRTVYPPISFVFLKIFGIGSCYRSNPILARECDWIGITTILVCYFLSAFVAFLAFRKNDPATCVVRGISFGLGLPLLFTLERGNLILACFIFFVLAHGPLVRSKVARAFFAGLTINFKPYLLLPVLAWLFGRRWRMLEIAAVSTLLIYLVSLAIFGSGTIFQISSNTRDWVTNTSGFVWEQVYYSTSFTPFLGFDTHRFPARDFIPSDIVDWVAFLIPIVIGITQLASLFVLAGAWLQPRALEPVRVSIIVFATYLIGQSPGGYTETFLLFLVFLERWERPGPIIALIATYLLCIPYDFVISTILTLSGDSWLAGRPVTAPFGMSVGIFLRPALILILLWALLFDSLAKIVRAHAEEKPILGLGVSARPPSQPAGA